MNSDSPRVLFLGPAESQVLAWLRDQREAVTQVAEPLTGTDVGDFEFIVSHGYRHILRADVLDQFPRRAVNLHISYLPFNRGADPNFWSWADSTAKGVTIHLLDPGVDTGAVVAQSRVDLGLEHTLRTSYEALQIAMLGLFRSVWPSVLTGNFVSHVQVGPTTTHRAAERLEIWDRFPAGWDTPVAEVPGRARG